jgi:hypothetical protein
MKTKAAKVLATSRAKTKWRFAIGTTSRVPGRPGVHYFIADFDDVNLMHVYRSRNNYLLEILNSATYFQWQRTPHGWHLFTNVTMKFCDMKWLLIHTMADTSWITIGYQRGYWFLADKEHMRFPYPVERMKIYNGKNQGNPRRP